MPIITLSFGSLLVYFCILREENDVDEELRTGSLYRRIEGLEEAQLNATLKYNEDHGIDNRPIRARLAEIHREAAAK
jgi:hypothetical protein